MTNDDDEAAAPQASGTVVQLVTLIKRLPVEMSLKLWRWVLSLHQPLEVGEPHYTWCATCKKPWPCETVVTASDQIDALKQA